MNCNCKSTGHDVGCPFGGVIVGARMVRGAEVTPAPKTYEDGLREMLECACKAVEEARREAKRTETRMEFDLCAGPEKAIRRAALERFGVEEQK